VLTVATEQFIARMAFRTDSKEKSKRIKDKSPHLSTARLLDEAKKDRQTKTKGRNQQ
jgi:hypothetical protein